MQQEPKAINFDGVLSMTGQIWTQKVVCVVLGITSNDFFEIWYNINSLNLEKPDRAQVWENGSFLPQYGPKCLHAFFLESPLRVFLKF